MKKSDIGRFLLVAIVVVRVSAEDIADLTQADGTDGLLSRIVAKQYEALRSDYHDPDEALELRKLYLRYFQTEESLSSNGDTFANVNFHNFPHYITSDDGAIRVFSWDTQSGRFSHPDSLVQFRDSNGKLRTASIPQIISETDLYERYFVAYEETGGPYGFHEIYILKKGVYLLVGPINTWVNFVTLEIREDAIVPYYAFKDNKIIITADCPARIDLHHLPKSYGMQIVPENNSFAIELDMLFPKDPKNMFEPVTDRRVIKDEDTFERREKFVFNGTIFEGNYWVLLEHWMRGERPADVSQFFPEIEPWENTIHQRCDKTESKTSAEAEIAFDVFDVFDLSNQEGTIEKQEFDEPIKNNPDNSHFLLFLILLLCLTTVVCGIYFYKKIMSQSS